MESLIRSVSKYPHAITHSAVAHKHHFLRMASRTNARTPSNRDQNGLHLNVIALTQAVVTAARCNQHNSAVQMIYRVRINKKYRLREVKDGDTFKLNYEDVRDAQKAAYYYRSLCKRPINIVITRSDTGYYCQRID